MEHRKVLRISTVVLAMAVFSLVIAKPGMAYAHSFHLGDFDISDLHFHHGELHGVPGFILGAAGGIYGGAHGGG